MCLSHPEEAILIALSKEQKSIDSNTLGLWLEKLPIKLSREEFYDYIESMEEKSLGRVKIIKALKGQKAFTGLRITGEGRNATNAL